MWNIFTSFFLFFQPLYFPGIPFFQRQSQVQILGVHLGFSKLNQLISVQLLLLILSGGMPERKLWTEQEDKALRYLKEEKGLQKWSQISKQMNIQFKISGRTGKQCRQRYHNHLDKSILALEWTPQEEQVLFRLHNEVGNKWSLMSQQLPGRTDNCVKNHFYSRLRKGVRRLNKVISQKLHKDCSEVKISFLYKILEISQSKFKNNCKYDQELIDQCIEIKNQLYLLDDCEYKGQTERAVTHREYCYRLIFQINRLEGKFKRSGKTGRQKETKYSQGSTSQKAVQQYVTKQEESDEPFYRVFKRFCEDIVKSQPT